MDQETAVSQSILENMSDGVMTISMTGKIITFNPAAAQILALEGQEVKGEPFARIFMEQPENDAFNQAILDAIYESHTTHNHMVDFFRGDRSSVSLSLTTSFLKTLHEGKEEKAGVIAVFSDVTEVKHLRDQEMRLTQDLKDKHRELQDAFLRLEEGNERLQAVLKRAQVVRWVATLLIVAGFLGGGFFLWNKNLIPRPDISMPGSGSAREPGVPLRTLTAAPVPISSAISLPGVLEPRKVENVVSPLSGKVLEKHFSYGELVERGDVLVTMQTAEIELQYRDAKASYIKALQQLRSLEDWKNGTEVQSARRAVTKARLTLDSQRRKLAETERLFEQGIVPRSELDSIKEQVVNQEIDFKATEAELQSVLEKGSREHVTISRLETQNARIKMEELEKQIDRSVVHAPVSGVVILQEARKGGDSAKAVERGVSYEQGEIMLSIGDLEGLSVKTRVDEVDVLKVKKGQKVLVSGDAFTDITLEGHIRNISSLATKENNVPVFDIAVSIEDLEAEQRKKIRLGMSANLEVIVYENPEAIMIPIESVFRQGSETLVRVRDRESGAVRAVAVETGITTLDSVEIVRGLAPGDEVVIEEPSRSP